MSSGLPPGCTPMEVDMAWGGYWDNDPDDHGYDEEEPGCDCGDTGWALDDDDRAIPCPHCSQERDEFDLEEEYAHEPV